MIAIEPLLRQPTVQAVGWALLHFVWQGALVAALTAVALLALRRSAADIRYIVATIGMSLMLTLPIVTGVQKWQAAQRASGPAASVSISAAAATRPVAPIDNRRSPSTPAASSQTATPALTRSLADRAVSAALPRIEPLLPMLLLVWVLGVTVLSLRLMTGWLWIQRLRTHGVSAAGDSWQRMAIRLARRLHITRTIALLESTLVEVPTVIGWMKPVVLLPASALTGLAPHQLEAVLAHELAHIRRHDYIVNLLQTLVETLLFYHPAVWWLSARIRTERENCCDDLAVSLCGDPVAYASALADLESLRGNSSLVMAATGGSLLQRVRRLLGAPTSHAGRGPAWLAGSAAILLICGMAVGADGLQPSQASTRSSKPVTVSAVPQQSAPVASTHAKDEVVRAQEQALRAQSDALRAEEARVAIVAETMRAEADQSGDRDAQLLDLARVQATIANAQEQIHAASTVLNDQSAAMAQAEIVASTVPVRAAEATQAVAVAQAAVAAVVASTAEQSTSGTHHDSSGNWIWSNNGEKLSVTYNGSFEFTDDDTDVREVSPGGYLKISDAAWLGRHTIEIRERDGALERRYFVNGSERPFEPEGQQWLHDHLPRFVRNTGIGADRRVARLLKAGGPSSVMDEITRIEGNYVKRVYFSELFKQATLTPEQYRQAMAQAAREIHSDYELATFLISLADRLPADDASRAAYFNAAGGINSAYELRRVYSTMLKRGPVSPQILAGILEHASTIQSDYELSELLRQIVAQQPLDDRTRPLYVKATSKLQSDYERHRVLSAALGKSTLDPQTLRDLLDRAADMSSDYEAATFLTEVLKMNGIEGDARAPFFRVVGRIQSSYERGRVLQALVRRPDVSDDTLIAVLHSAGQMGSSYDRAQVLLLVASTHSISGNVRDAYIDAADHLGNYEQGQVLTALVKNERRVPASK